MENSLKRGVFLLSMNLDSACMINCLHALLNAHPSIKFTSSSSDDKLRGFRVCFSEPEDTTVIENHRLTIDNQPISIYPLSTYLRIHDVNKKSRDFSKEDVHSAISEKYGKVLRTMALTTPSQRYKWLVEIDVPEIKELEIFQHDRASEMTVTVPCRNNSTTVTLKVMFWCRRCKDDGHFQYECLRRVQPENSSEIQVKSEWKTDKKLKTDMQPRNSVSDGHQFSLSSENHVTETDRNKRPYHLSCEYASIGSQIRKNPLETQPNSKSSVKNSGRSSEEREAFPLESVENYAAKLGREEIEKTDVLHDGNEHLQRTEKWDFIPDARKTTSGCLLKDKKIKKEVEENETPAGTKEGNCVQNKKYRIPNTIQLKEQANITAPKENLFGLLLTNEDNSNQYGDVSSGDDEIQTIQSSNSSTNFCRQESKSSIKEDVSKPEQNEGRMKDYSFSSFHATPGPSNPPPTTARPSRGAEDTTALSEQLQDCINTVCNTTGVLDRVKLNAFLIHVKKKSNPIRVALNFTKNTDGLKQQLKNIVDMYYSTPQAGTKEDMQFIKWLSGLVERFVGTIPKKRKRSGLSVGGSPNKK